MKRFHIIDTITGWVVFLVSAITYILTTEDTASFWDCGEFISTANKLLVGHPPGAPFFMIVGRFFAVLAPNVELIAKYINVMSALASAFTILFLYWTITHLARRIFMEGAEGEAWRGWAVVGAGVVGALAYTFSDTFWFSAVEGEVYAMSSLFTAIVFWAILKWENVADEPHANRWIILIAYLMGLSIGVHLLNLLAIPAIVMVYYFKKYEVTTKRTIAAFLISCAIVIAILYGIIPGLVKIASYFELFFVNSLGFGYNSGAIFYAFLLIGIVVWAIHYTRKNEHRIMNLIMTAVAVIILGYSSFAMVVIRSCANPTMDQNSPEDVFSLMTYLNREQYGDRPLFYGKTFSSPIDRAASNDKGKPIYIQRPDEKGNDRYVVADYQPDTKYKACVLFPRMYSSEERHVEQYKQWSNYEGRNVLVRNADGTTEHVEIPTMLDNLKFFFSYQVNFMYWRYFMWNFSGRQNDIQSSGELTHGNWITGISFIDNMMLGDQDLLPDSLKNNKGHNRYFMLPFLLGLAGLFFQFGRGKNGVQGFWVVMLLFFMTGLAIVMYLNQTPLQPRERDYAYAGSFYAFAIWIGLGVLQIVELFRKVKLPGNVAAIAASVVCLLCVPCVMAQQIWDDHDRSGCTIARDIAYDYLNSCDENAVIFTNGDNDTFPLWYVQEVEGVRTDVRVCNLSYLQTSWYCDQMKRKAYESDPLPISFTHDQYTADRDVIYLTEDVKTPMELKDVISFVASSDARTKLRADDGQAINYIPGTKIKLTVDPEVIKQKGIVSENHFDKITNMNINFSGKRYILKNELMVLDMLLNSNWDRPLYYAVTVGPENFCGLSDYFQLEGLAYRIAPVKDNSKSESGQVGHVDAEKMYDRMMNKFRWGFYNKPGLYLDENKTRMASNLRNNLARLATALLNESDVAASNGDSAVALDKRERAIKVLDKIQVELPDSLIPHNYFSLSMVSSYSRAGNSDEASRILKAYAKDNFQELHFYMSLNEARMMNQLSDVQRSIAIYEYIMRTAQQNNLDSAAADIHDMYSAELDKVEAIFSKYMR